eukprot:COSAG03_NODE_1007_length_5050_cov_2.052515_1_plen_137_part_10
MVTWLVGLLAVAAPHLVAARSRTGSNHNNNKCRAGTGSCAQWTNHSLNPYAVRNPNGEWACLHGQLAIGLPDEWVTVAPPAPPGDTQLPPQEFRKSVEYLPDSAWVDDHTENGRSTGCGCECDVVRARARQRERERE